MTNPAYMHNFGAHHTNSLSHIATAIAAGTGDASETDGAVVDRQGCGSGTLVIAANATLSSGKKITVKATVQHDTDPTGATMADVAASLQPEGAADSVVLTITEPTTKGIYSHKIDFSTLNRYIRAQTHMDLNASGTDVGQVCAIWVLGGKDRL